MRSKIPVIVAPTATSNTTSTRKSLVIPSREAKDDVNANANIQQQHADLTKVENRNNELSTLRKRHFASPSNKSHGDGSTLDFGFNHSLKPLHSGPTEEISEKCMRSQNLVIAYGDIRTTGRCPINMLEEKQLKRIFSFVNHSDLIMCRLVRRDWNSMISTDRDFLEKTVYVVNIRKKYNFATDIMVYEDLTSYANLPFTHARFQYIDYKFLKDPKKFVFRNSDNDKYLPSSKFLGALRTVEFRNCFLHWQMIKKILEIVATPEALVIFNCHILDEVLKPDHMNEYEEFVFGNAIFGLKKLEIYETRFLTSITLLLAKINGFSSQGLSTINVTYYPPATRQETKDEDTKLECMDFCRELKGLISLCGKSLKNLCINVQHETTLSLIGYHICKELEVLRDILDLKEFQLSPSLGCWIYKPELIPKLNIVMTGASNMDSQKSTKAIATSIARFLASQRNLEVLALPCIEHTNAFRSLFKTALEQLPCAPNLNHLKVPSAGFLPEDIPFMFPKLKGLKVGGSCCEDFTPGWDILSIYSNHQRETPPASQVNIAVSQTEFKIVQRQPKSIAQMDKDFIEKEKMLKKLEELVITSDMIPANFKLIVKSMSNLTTLDVSSGANVPIIDDNDLQSCIKYLSRLKSLYIGCSNNLTDFGVTGIPNEYCEAMFKNQKYSFAEINLNVWDSEKVPGRPLSDLEGLRNLILMGSSTFSDIGIAYGLKFNELKNCHLPYSDYITSWGIERFASVNPSLESFGLSGVSQLSKDAFLELRKTHYRIGKGDVSRLGYFAEHVSPIVEDFSLVLVSPKKINQLFWKILHQLAGLVSEHYGVPIATQE